jgi:hypothetical protein
VHVPPVEGEGAVSIQVRYSSGANSPFGAVSLYAFALASVTAMPTLAALTPANWLMSECSVLAMRGISACGLVSRSASLVLFG